MLQNIILPHDLKLAKALYECCYSCLNRAQLELKSEKLDEADRWVKEYERCKRDLDKLINKKKQRDNMMLLVADLKGKNIDAALIKKLTAENSEQFNTISSVNYSMK